MRVYTVINPQTVKLNAMVFSAIVVDIQTILFFGVKQ